MEHELSTLKRQLCDYRNVRAPAGMARYTASAAGERGGCPVGHPGCLEQCLLETLSLDVAAIPLRDLARLRQQFETVFNRIESGRDGQFIDEGLDRERVDRILDRAPPSHGDRARQGRVFHAEPRNVVRQLESTPH